MIYISCICVWLLLAYIHSSSTTTTTTKTSDSRNIVNVVIVIVIIVCTRIPHRAISTTFNIQDSTHRLCTPHNPEKLPRGDPPKEQRAHQTASTTHNSAREANRTPNPLADIMKLQLVAVFACVLLAAGVYGVDGKKQRFPLPESTYLVFSTPQSID